MNRRDRKVLKLLRKMESDILEIVTSQEYPYGLTALQGVLAGWLGRMDAKAASATMGEFTEGVLSLAAARRQDSVSRESLH